MYTLTLSKQALNGKGLLWWQWCKVIGLWLLIAAAILYLAGMRHPVMLSLAVHMFVDFTCQSNETSAGKAKRNWRILILHGFVAGGWPAVFYGPVAVVVSTLAHTAIDATGKFGLKGSLGPLVDQVSHVVVLVLIALCYLAQ